MDERKKLEASELKEKLKSFDLNRIKETADAVAKFVDIVVGVVMSVMLAIVGIQQNLSMEKQEEQFAALQSQLNEQAQTPVFRLAEDYDAEGFTGYVLINDGRMVTCLDIRLEKWLHIQTSGETVSSFIVPYNLVSAYIPVPEQRQSIRFWVERAAEPVEEGTGTTPETDGEEGIRVENELPIRVDIMNEQTFAAGLEARLREKEALGYQIRSMEILTISFIDKEQVHETRRYFIAAQGQAGKAENEIEHPLYVIDEKGWAELKAQIPAQFEWAPASLNAGIYSHPLQSDFIGRRNDDQWQSGLCDMIIEYIDGCNAENKQ